MAEDRVRQLLNVHQSDDKLARDAQDYWSRPIDSDNSLDWHAKDSAVFGTDAGHWHAMGTRHPRLYEAFARAQARPEAVERMVDWGCGGGANAIAFAPFVSEIVGVYVSAHALADCARQLAASNAPAIFKPVQITVANPEVVLEQIPGESIDLFLSFYVFALLPSPEHGSRV